MSNPGNGTHGFLPRLGIAALALSLVVAAAGVPERFAESSAAFSGITGANTWARGSRARLGPDLHESLVAADALLPRNAVVLLVTPGRDVQRDEYIAFHRALYLLAPRPVSWAAPATGDGTWESRWWTEIAPSRDASMRRAHEVGATHIFSLSDSPWSFSDSGAKELPGNALIVQIGSASATRSKPTEWRAAPRPYAAVAAFCVILLAGWVMYGLFALRNAPASTTETIAMSWLLGCGAVSLAMFWMIRLGIAPSAQRIAITVAAVAGFVLTVRRHGLPRMSFRFFSRGGKAGKYTTIVSAVLAVWLVAEIVGLVIQSAAGPLAGWDGWVTWAMKARVLHLQHDAAALLMDVSREIANRSYPLLLPLTEAWFFGWAGAADDRFAAFVTLGFLVALTLLLLSSLRSRATVVVTLAIAAAFLTTPYVGLLASLGYADVVLAAYALAAAIALRRWMENPETSVLLAALLLGMLPWVKLEGVVLLVALLIGALVSIDTAAAKRKLIGAAAIAALVCAGPWYLQVAAADLPQSAYAIVPHMTIDRAGAIVTGLVSRAAAIEWHGIWIASMAAVVIAATRRVAAPFLPIAIGVYVAALALSFLFSSYEPLAQHVLRSADRLLLHVAALGLLIIADVIAVHRRVSSATAEPREGHQSG